MVSEQRIKLMTKMAIFEKYEGDRCRKVTEFRRRDYIALCGFGQFFIGTVMFAVGFAAYFILKLKDVIFSMGFGELKDLAIRIGVIYLIFTLIYQIFVRIRAKFYYDRCMRRMKEFEDGFAKLNQIYIEEEEFTAPLEYTEHEDIH